jgi:hypothetical protein
MNAVSETPSHEFEEKWELMFDPSSINKKK